MEDRKMKIVVFTGAGISAESGIMTFRDENGLWREKDWKELACAEAFQSNHQRVLDFYNDRRRQLATVHPNKAHMLLAQLETHHDVTIITQNVDDLHERAGSTDVLHLHGDLRYVTSSKEPRNPEYTVEYPLDQPIEVDNIMLDGSPMRPNVVWFGESVDNAPKAASIIEKVELFIVIGTSLNVYPATSLLMYPPANIPFYIIDPKTKYHDGFHKVTHIESVATEGVERLVSELNLLSV